MPAKTRSRRSEISNRLAAAGGLMTAEAVAAAILRGIERGRFRDRAGSLDDGAGALAQRGSPNLAPFLVRPADREAAPPILDGSS